MVTSLRYDFAPITKSDKTDEGFLRVWCKAARTGVQTYRRADGTIIREYRPPEEVSKPESLATYGLKSVTLLHPPVAVNSTNRKDYDKGTSGSQVNYTDGFVSVALVVKDQDAIDTIERGDATEVSAGYRVDFDPTPGITPEGERYDGIQRNIRVNHIAIVPKGRAGPEVRLLLDHLDAADGVAVEVSQPISHLPAHTPMTVSVKLDGVTVELPTEVAGLVQSYVRDSERELQIRSDNLTELRSRLDALTEQNEQLAGERDAAIGRADAYEVRVDELEGETSNFDLSRIDTAQLDSLISQRLDTLNRLAPAFGDEFKFDGIDEPTLYRQAFANITGTQPRDDADDAYIKGAVDMYLLTLDSSDGDDDDDDDDDDRDDNDDSSLVLQQALNNRTSTSRSDATGSAGYASRTKDAWKQPLQVSKGAV